MKQKQFLFSSFFFFLENRAFYEITSTNMVKPEAADNMTPARVMLDK